MARPPADPSGRAQPLNARVSPARLAHLDAVCAATGKSRADVLSKLIDRLQLPDEPAQQSLLGVTTPPVTSPQPPVADCLHKRTKADPKLSGVARCLDCNRTVTK